MRQQQTVRRISLTVAATAVAATAVFLASGTGLAEGLGQAAPAAAEPTDGGTSVGVTEGTTSGETDGGSTVGTTNGADGGADGGANTGVSEGTTTGGADGGADGGANTGVSEGTTTGETTGGGEPTPTPTATQPGTGQIPYTAHPCWTPDSKPITGTFVALVPAGTLPTGNKATLVELRFAPKTDPATGIRGDDEILTRFAPAGGTWTAARPAKLELAADAIKPFRPVVDGTALRMPEIRLTDINCWDATVASLGGTLRFGGEGGNGGAEVKVPVTWQRS
ncbi:hypothetical protein [Streptomyces sp. NPDC126499]|uniref:hypothetical protein n=1 Tax=Streptomyces sp. NPDC126499 TaxID=3155314 RepID=UPI0033341C7F